MRALLVCSLLACARPPLPPRPVALWFGGDVHLGHRGARALEQLRLDAPLVVNLEGPIASTPRPSTAQALFNPPDTAQRLRSAGVVAAGVINNHALDDGAAGLARTQALLREVGLAPLGEASINGVKVMQIDLSAGVPGALEAQLLRVRPTVVLFHVLAPPLYLPEPELRRAVDLALAADARAVLAHGSHSLAGVERRGAAVVAWGLGNLAFDCDCTTEDEGLLVRLTFDGPNVTEALVRPVRAGLHGALTALPPDGSTVLDLLESLGSRLHHRTLTWARW